MKQEILRIHRLRAENESGEHINDISCCFFQGECSSILGLAGSGKALFNEILQGAEERFSGKMVFSGQECSRLFHGIYSLRESHFSLSDWTVAEYMGLVSFPAESRKSLGLRMQKHLDSLHMAIDAQRKLSALTELEYRMVDLAKACLLDKKLLLIDDEFEGCTDAEILTFKKKLSDLTAARMASIVFSHSERVLYLLSDHFLMLVKGRIARKYKHDAFTNHEEMGRFLIRHSINGELPPLPNEQKTDEDAPLRYHIQNLRLPSLRKNEFHFYSGQTCVIQTMNLPLKNKLFSIFSGREAYSEALFSLDGETVQMYNIADFVQRKIASIGNINEADRLFDNLSIADNLLLPSLQKMSGWSFVRSGRGLRAAMNFQSKHFLAAGTAPIAERNANEKISILFERWLIFQPKVLILLEPFIHCDAYGIAIIKSYVRRFQALGTSIVIFNAHPERSADLAHSRINLDKQNT